jgi:hypothetical protein
MRDSNGNGCDLWVMVDHDGERTLFKLVEMGNGGDGLKLASELRAPAVVVDMALPALPALDEMPGRRRPSGSSRLILLNVRTVTGDHAHGVVVRRSRQGELLNASSVRHGDVPRARRFRERA